MEAMLSTPPKPSSMKGEGRFCVLTRGEGIGKESIDVP
jgi:hypothetical protein